MAIIDKIQLSGTVYTIGNETTTAVTSASTDNEIPTAKAVYDAIPQGGGGKAIEAGRGITVTTGDTADTVSFNLPLSSSTLTSDSIVGGYFGNKSMAQYGFAFGDNANCGNSGSACIALGRNVTANGNSAIALGSNNTAKGKSVAIGRYINTNIEGEIGVGIYNVSSSASTTFGDSGNTLFSVGNGTSESSRHNAFEIRQNGDIYITKDGQDVKLQDQLGGGGGSSYTAGNGIDITNDVISVTGKVDTSAFTEHTADTVIHVTSTEKAAWNGKQDALVSGTNIKTINGESILGEGNITIQGGSGESCTVDSTTIFYTFNDRYSNDGLDMRARYVVLDYGQHKTEIPNVSIDVNFRDANYNTYVNQNINLDYSTSSYTLGDISQAEYIDVTYDSTIEDFKIAVSTAYTSTVFVNYIIFYNGNIKVPFFTISSGSPCTAIENDIPTAISELGNSMLKGVREISFSSEQNALSIYTEKFGGNGISTKIKLDEIDGSNSTLKPDIYIGLGTSGWTEINLSQQCIISSLKSTKYRVTYNNSELDSYSMGLQFIVEYARNEVTNHVNFDETHHPSLQTQDVFSAATLDWNASTRELVITYPETIELYGKQESVNIRQIYSNGCNFGNAITKLESYGEEKQSLKPYVKETRAALSGKQDTLVSGTNIKTINGETLLGEGNIDIQGGGVNVVQTTGTSTTDVMSQDAVTTAINTVSGAIPSTYVKTISIDTDQGWRRFVRFSTPNNYNYFILDNPKINGTPIHIFDAIPPNIHNFSLVETSAITTSISSSSTDSQVPSAKAVYDIVGNIETLLSKI